MALCDALDRIAKLYQIPNYDLTVNSMLLSEWIMEEYQHHDLELILETLRKPPVLNDQTWRLTPDTLKTWIDLKRTERENDRIKKESEQRQQKSVQNQDLSEETVRLVEEFKTKLKEGVKTVAPLTESEIKQEGQHRPKKPVYHAPGLDYFKEVESRIRTAQYLTIKERNPGMSDSDIWKKVDEYNQRL